MSGFEIPSYTWWKLSFRSFASVGSDGYTDFILPLKGLISFHQFNLRKSKLFLKISFSNYYFIYNVLAGSFTVLFGTSKAFLQVYFDVININLNFRVK